MTSVLRGRSQSLENPLIENDPTGGISCDTRVIDNDLEKRTTLV
jgi:hypothetical protein